MKEGEGKVCMGEVDAFKGGRDNIDSVSTVVGESRAKVISAVSVWIPREAVVGSVKGKTKLTGGVERVGGEVVGKMMESRPSRERGVGRQGRMRLRVSSAWGRRRSQRSAGKSGWVEVKMEMR